MSENLEQHEPIQHDGALSSSGIAQLPGQSPPAKRPASDDDIQFVSSNPVVKKRRLSEQKPALMLASAKDPMPPPPPPPPPAQPPSPKQHTMFASQPTPAHRFHSLGGGDQAGVPSSGFTPAPAVESRGASLPVFRNFEFPSSLPSMPSQRPRASEAISPKHLPQALPPPPEVCASTNHPSQPTAPAPPPQNSVTIGEISCLDVNGVPTNTPGFDANRVFVADGSIMGGLGMNTTGAATSAANVFKPLAGQNVIPFAMYSTGSFVPMPQMHGIAQHPPMGNMGLGRPHSPTPGPKPPCLHCAQIRQQTLLRQAQGAPSPQPPGQAPVQSHTPTVNQYHHHHPPPTPTSRPGPIPRSTPPTPRPPTSAPALQPPPPPTTRHQHQPPRPTTPSPPRPNPSTTTTPYTTSNSNLLRDVIQTVHDCFPYAPVAARHGVLPARVAEVLAGVVVAPPPPRGGLGGGGGRG
ncbi:hypothetical protein C8A05DRAFT_16950 [Staphylotrichum tortipilum]|uniref:Uncharacterized protein n=1 Tax=Staphylotrichum tortipilum TaxID=2831512 RepID=A0AAN6MHH4_9PEZI|nr:hypothetical protein C8A05DRAFT_16950 [Staphylotrichum longicolle]